MSQEQNKKALGVAMALGFELLSLVLIGIFLGYFLGGYWEHKEIGAIVGCGLAFVLWIWRLIRSKRYLM